MESDSLSHLLEKQKELASQIETLRNQQKKEAMTQIISLAEKFQFTSAEIAFALNKKSTASKKRGTVAPKYRDPATGASWTGRGKPPAWIAGKNREKFLIR